MPLVSPGAGGNASESSLLLPPNQPPLDLSDGLVGIGRILPLRKAPGSVRHLYPSPVSPQMILASSTSWSGAPDGVTGIKAGAAAALKVTPRKAVST
ncbi:hypothetical protein AUC69_08310 [Methyloceanibacter superfactus]|uniref:Uncharacterized protein n=1 Tax=Methyloceanibacter superfactus TaxID=1774969 RepID=A0A1E3W1D9_9HYPH|nr:hypothetical protein AUC69_08310 [Methyloceanibacter superfactus]